MKSVSERRYPCKIKHLLSLAIFIFVMFVLIGCSGEPPHIRQQYWQINIVQDLEHNRIYEELSIYLQVEDPDGLEDIESLYVINDDSEIFWELENGQWEVYTYENQEVWIGSHLTQPDFSKLPRGNYRVLVLDGIGDRDQSEFFIKREYPPVENYRTIQFPSLTHETNGIRIKSSFNNNIIWVRGADQELLNYYLVETEVFNKRVLFSNSEVQRDADKIYIYVNNGGYGLISGPFPVE